MLVGAVTVGVAAPAFAQLPVPTVQAPVPVPTVQVPVPVPTVRVPVPTVQAPVPVPTVQVPQVEVPSVPPVAPPSGGGGGGSGGGSSGSGGGSSSGSRSSSGGGASGGGSRSSSSGGGGGSSASSSGGGSSPSTSSSRSAAGRSNAPRRGSKSRSSASSRRTSTSKASPTCASAKAGTPERRECELRKTVATASRCLSDLSPAQRRVLVLRAGVGPGPPRSRGGVAKRLKISTRRVIRLERTGLTRLRTLAKRGACAPPAQTVTAGVVAPAGASGANTTAALEPSAGARSGSGSERETEGNRGEQQEPR